VCVCVSLWGAGAFLLSFHQLLDIVHPAAKTLVDIARSQDSEVGDGTTTVTLLAGEFLRESRQFVEDGVHPQNIIRSFRQAGELAVAHVKTQAISIEGKDQAEKLSLLQKCAETTLNSKLVGGEKAFFAKCVPPPPASLARPLFPSRLLFHRAESRSRERRKPASKTVATRFPLSRHTPQRLFFSSLVFRHRRCTPLHQLGLSA